MAPIRRQRKSSDTKQRSFHLTDDVYNIVEREASAQGVSNSAWVSNVIQNVGANARTADTLKRGTAEALAAAPPRMRATNEPAAPSTEAQRFGKPAGKIVLPDETVSEFKVEGQQVRGKRLRSDNELSGVEGGAPKRKGRNRSEEIEL